MPLGLWKSKWEIHREDSERIREESERRHAEYREESERRHAEYREEMREARRRSDKIAEETRDLREETRDLRAHYDHEIAESRLFNRELLIRMEKTYAGLGSTLGRLEDEIVALRREVHELKHAVDAQTKAIMRLVDRFEDRDG